MPTPHLWCYVIRDARGEMLDTTTPSTSLVKAGLRRDKLIAEIRDDSSKITRDLAADLHVVIPMPV